MDFFATLYARYPKEEIRALEEASVLPARHGFFLGRFRAIQEQILSLYPDIQAHPLLQNYYFFDPVRYPLGKSLLHDVGGFYILDAASCYCACLLQPKPGEKILDFCAAPGGKTVTLALSCPEATVLSNDISYARAKELSRNVERMGLDNVAVTCGDLLLPSKERDHYFDAILLDAPCSGSAMFRKEPKMKDDWSEGKVDALTHTQKELLEGATRLLAPGGRILYCTCSFSYEEDEGVILSFLNDHPEFSLVPLNQGEAFYSHPDLPEAIHLFPHRFQGEGQFACLLLHQGKKEVRGEERRFAQVPKGYEGILVGRDNVKKGKTFYSLHSSLPVQGLSLLRYGVEVGNEESGRFVPSLHLARSGLEPRLIELDETTVLAYLSGETFPTKEKDGYAAVTFLKIPLGYVKVSQGTAKNHYPKGLRHRY